MMPAANRAKRFFLDLLGGTGAIITPTEVELAITDNDTPITRSIGTEVEVPLPSFTGDKLGGTITAFGSSAFVGSLDFDGSGLLRGGVFAVDLQTRKTRATIKPTGFMDGAAFGQGLAVDEELLAVGAYKSRENPAAPAIYLYDRETLSERMVLRPPTAESSGFGTKIALGASHILVGLPYEPRRGYQVGDVLVYDRATGAFLSRIEAPTRILGGQFGLSVTFSGNRAVIGGNGRVFCFDLQNNNRLLFEVERDTRDTSHITLDFGKWVQANESYIVVGNPWDDSFIDNSGSVLVYDATSGALINTVRTRFEVANSNFGNSVSLMGRVLAVTGGNAGVDLVDIPTGHELLHFTIPSSFVRYGYLQNVILTDSHVVVGAPWGKGIDLGRVLSFRRDGLELGGLAILAKSASAAEGNSGTTNFAFTVSRTGSKVGSVEVMYAVSGKSVTAADFGGVLPTGTVTIADGATSTTVTIPVSADLLVEPDETFIVSISAPNGNILPGSVASTTATIIDDDRATVSLAKITDGVEAAVPTNALFRVTQTAEASVDTVVSYAVSGSAVPGTDFTALTGSVIIPAGRTTADITVAVLDEHLVEPTETVSITLVGISSGDPEVTLGASPTASAEITDNVTGVITLATVQPIKRNIRVNPRTGLFEVVVKVTNTSPYPVDGFRLHVDFSAYMAAYPNLRLQNASSPSTWKDVYVDHRNPVAVDATVTFTLTFYSRDRKFPKRFAPICNAESLRLTAPTATQVVSSSVTARSASNTSGILYTALSTLPTAPAAPRVAVLQDRSVQLEFPSVSGQWYSISYTSDLIRWVESPTPEQATGTTLRWTDSGPPRTASHPAGEPARFYRIREVAAPLNH